MSAWTIPMAQSRHSAIGPDRATRRTSSFWPRRRRTDRRKSTQSGRPISGSGSRSRMAKDVIMREIHPKGGGVARFWISAKGTRARPSPIRRRKVTSRQIAQRAPYPVDVEAGKTYYWCACGQSKKQPFCDGSHKTTDIVPVAWTAEKAGKSFFCGCKHSKTEPLCDGSHAKL
jgi:CDGSH iron-sulfur domain-containing protein 3